MLSDAIVLAQSAHVIVLISDHLHRITFTMYSFTSSSSVMTWSIDRF